MTHTAIQTPDAPTAIGPYSQAIAAGDLVFLSGQIALDPATGELVGEGDIEAQTERVLDNLHAVLAAAGASFATVVKATIFLTDLSNFGKVNAIYARRFEGLTPPARACVECSALPKGVDVEIEMIARVGR